MNKYFMKIAVVLLLGAFMLNISGCNTVNGVGRDMQKAGEEIQEEADEHKGDD
jgi:predicted small secreted protein